MMLKRSLNSVSIIYRSIFHCSLSHCSFLFRIIVLLFIITGLLGQSIMPVLSQDPTIPTRTPTPDPNPPTPTPTATPDDGGEPPPPAPTDTPGAGATATSTIQPGTGATPTRTVTATSTPTADDITLPSCDEQPIVRALKDVVNVFAGPGEDYAVLGALTRDETRPLIGRAEFARWWKIQFDPATSAWVDDRNMEAYGNTAGVPLVKPPPIEGATPTPGPKWRPTTLPGCTPTSTPTLSPTPTETPTPTPTAQPTRIGAEEGESNPNDAAGNIEAAAPESQELVVSPPSPLLTTYILPVAGISLIGLGLIIWLLARRSGRAAAEGSDTGESSGG
jgi:hypothetical protein